MDDTRIAFTFTKNYSPGFGAIAHQMIVPQHHWAGIAEPVKYANPTPVATGPFTEVNVFRYQVYELGRNPHYWGGAPKITALRMLASVIRAATTMVGGEVDWAGLFVPDIDRIYVNKNPAHHRYWFPRGHDFPCTQYPKSPARCRGETGLAWLSTEDGQAGDEQLYIASKRDRSKRPISGMAQSGDRIEGHLDKA